MNRKTIGNLSNPVLGEIGNISSASIFPRLARARVVAYSETGFPDFEPLSTNRPSIIASIVPISEFPLDPLTGFPDVSRLISQSPTGDVPDLNTGDPDFSTPEFREVLDLAAEPLDQIAFGRPDGTTFDVGYTGRVLSAGRLSGIFVRQVLQGCVITFRTDADLSDSGSTSVEITGASQLAILGDSPSTSTPLELNSGDTIFAVTPTGASTPVEDPPSTADIKRL